MNIEFHDILNVNHDLVEKVREWRNSKEIKSYMINDHYISKNEHQEWILKLKKSKESKAWVIDYMDKPIGLVYLINIDYKNKKTDWGFYIADQIYRGKGIGSVILYKLMSHVFDYMNFNEMHTKVLENNITAIELYKKFGFKKEDVLDEKIIRNRKKIEIFIMRITYKEWRKIKEKYNNLIT